MLFDTLGSRMQKNGVRLERLDSTTVANAHSEFALDWKQLFHAYLLRYRSVAIVNEHRGAGHLRWRTEI